MTQCKKQRTVKDLFFLCSFPKQELSPNLIKRLEKPGDGLSMEETKIPIDAYISYDKYDYQGRIIDSITRMKVKHVCHKYSESIPPGVHTAIKTMKVNEVAWINARNFDMHLTQGLKDQGCHYRIVIDSFKHKNDDTLKSKKILFEKSKKQGMELFKKKEYFQAMKRYKDIINITEGLDKKKFTIQQLKQLREMNLNGKQNYLKCFSKVKKHDEDVNEQASKYLKQLIHINGLNELNLYLKANLQMHMRYLTDALETANLLYATNKQDGLKLIEKIKDRIKNKVRYAPL